MTTKPALMKGHCYADRKHTVVFPCIAEIKYDEIRVHVKYVRTEVPEHHAVVERIEFLSYAGKPLYNLNDLYSQMFLDFFRETGLTELDMGLEVNGNFNDSYRWVRSKNGIPKEKLDKATGKVAPALAASMVTWWLFDMPESVLPYSQRVVLRNEHARRLMYIGDNVITHMVHTPALEVVMDEAHLDRVFNDVRAIGKEGLMVKSLTHTYQRGKRIDGWLKMKPEAEADGVILSIAEAVSEEGVPLGRAGSVGLRLEDGSTANPHGIAHDLGKDMWARPWVYIGAWCTMNYMERDRAGGYRHPTFGRFREDKA